MSDVILGIENGVATVTINRPEVLNALTEATFGQIADALEEIGRDRSVGVAVITGSGDRAFCSGGDVNWESEWASEQELFARGVREAERLYAAIRGSMKPVIARVNGYAIGTGNILAYLCDFTVAAEHAIFGQNGPRVGSPAQGWMVSYLVRVVGAKRARELWMRCTRYTAQQALDWGLVNAVVPMAELDEEVSRWTADILSLSPSCIKVLKASFDDEYRGLRERQATVERDLMAEVNPGFWSSGEQSEGAAAFLAKRPPDFTPWR